MSLRRLLKKSTVTSSKYSNATFEVRNSFVTTFNLTQEESDKIKNLLTYKNEGAEQEMVRTFHLIKMAQAKKMFKFLDKLKRDLEEIKKQLEVCWFKNGKFPTGHLKIVCEALPDVKIVEKREFTEPEFSFRWNNRPYAPRPYQKDMIEIAKTEYRGVFESCVGSGKTLVMTYILDHFSVKSLVILPSTALLEQTKTVLNDAFGSSKVETISTAKIKSRKKLAPIRLVTIQTLASLQKQDMLEHLMGDVSLLCLDEFHHAGSSSYTNLLPEIDHIPYRFGFTGTFLRNDSKTLDMLGFLSNRLYYYPASRAIKEGFLTPVHFRISTLQGVAKQDYQKEYDANFCGSLPLLSTIHKIVKSINKNDQILILVDRKAKSGEIINKHLKTLGFDCKFISGDNKKQEVQDAIVDFNERKIKILIGSTVIGEGVDIKSTQHLILATGGKSTIKIVQAIGRAVRLDEGKDVSYVYDFNFEDTKYMNRHLKERIKIFEEGFEGDILWDNVA